MSGGSYDYVYGKILDAAATLRGRHRGEPLLVALADHLQTLAAIMRDVEWCDSGDSSWDAALHQRIRAFLAPGAEVRAATDHARQALVALQDALRATEAP